MSKNRKHPKYKPPQPRQQERETQMITFPRDPHIVEPSVMEEFPEHAKFVGFIIAEWSQIEVKLTLILAAKLSADQQIIIPMIAAIESSRARLNTIQAALYALAGPGTALRRRLGKVLEEADKLLTLRNRYAHAHFGPERESRELAITSLGGRTRPLSIPLHELKHHFERMKQLSHLLGVILAAELKLPLMGPDSPSSVPTHPLDPSDSAVDPIIRTPPDASPK
jgi:hypothetical protein